MNSKGRRLSAALAALRGSKSMELQVGLELIDIWFDDQGIHFRQSSGKAREGLLPWDLAMAMSLVPPEARPHYPVAQP